MALHRPPTAVVSDSRGVGKGYTSHAIIIEARSALEPTDPTRRAGPGQGALLGQVIVTTETDRRLLAKQEQRSFFESAVVRNVPIMKIVREVSPSLGNNNAAGAASLHGSASRTQFK